MYLGTLLATNNIVGLWLEIFVSSRHILNLAPVDENITLQAKVISSFATCYREIVTVHTHPFPGCMNDQDPSSKLANARS